MSNFLAIAAITTTLQHLIYQGTSEDINVGNVTTLPLDKARGETDSNQINLFLYHLLPNMAWRNHHPVVQIRRGETKKSPLGLDLFYLISVYGEKENEIKSHQLLGKVISLFHDLTKITPEMIESATDQELNQSNLHQQVEQINIRPLSLNFEEILQIWQGLNVPYRPCVCYQVSVILIDSQIPLTVPMPVLSQNNGQGRTVQIGFSPSLTTIELPNCQPSAQLGDLLTIRGNNLNKRGIQVRITHQQFKQSIALEPLADSTSNMIQVKIPEDEQNVNHWYIGLYILTLIFPEGENSQKQSNELPFVLSPRIASLNPRETRAGKFRLSVNCLPPLHPKQKAIILWGDRAFATRKQTNINPAYTKLTCQIPAALSGEHVVRLRVDGVDSIPVDFSTTPWQFDPNQTVIVN